MESNQDVKPMAATAPQAKVETPKPSTVAVKKTLDNIDPTTAKAKVLDIKIFGDPNAWLLLSKASSEREGWMKSTKAYDVSGVGCLVQVSTQQLNADGTSSLSEALQWIPGVKVIEERDGSGNVIARKLRHL